MRLQPPTAHLRVPNHLLVLKDRIEGGEEKERHERVSMGGDEKKERKRTHKPNDLVAFYLLRRGLFQLLILEWHSRRHEEQCDL